MNGVDELVMLRMSGRRPRDGVVVVIEPKSRVSGEPMFAEEADGTVVKLEFAPGDSFGDLRCVVGLPVLVSGSNEHERSVRAACMACVDAGASNVIGIKHDLYEATTETVFTHG